MIMKNIKFERATLILVSVYTLTGRRDGCRPTDRQNVAVDQVAGRHEPNEPHRGRHRWCWKHGGRSCIYLAFDNICVNYCVVSRETAARHASLTTYKSSPAHVFRDFVFLLGGPQTPCTWLLSVRLPRLKHATGLCLRFVHGGADQFFSLIGRHRSSFW